MSEASQALGRVLGRGSAHEGAHHWRVQKLTSVALALLGVWFVVSLILLPDLAFDTVKAWASGTCNAALLALLVVSACWHSLLGVQVVIEDYVHGVAGAVLLVASLFLHVLLGAIGVVAILRIAFGA